MEDSTPPERTHTVARLISKTAVFSATVPRVAAGHYGFSVHGGDTAEGGLPAPVVSLEAIYEHAVADSKLRDGDIIEAIDGRPVDSADAAKELLGAAVGSVHLQLRRVMVLQIPVVETGDPATDEGQLSQPPAPLAEEDGWLHEEVASLHSPARRRTSSRGSAATPLPDESDATLSPNSAGRRATISEISVADRRRLLSQSMPFEINGSDISPEEEEEYIMPRFLNDKRRFSEPALQSSSGAVVGEVDDPFTASRQAFEPSRRRSSEPSLSMVDLARLRISVDSFLATAASHSCDVTPTGSPLARSREDLLSPLERQRSPLNVTASSARQPVNPGELMARLSSMAEAATPQPPSSLRVEQAAFNGDASLPAPAGTSLERQAMGLLRPPLPRERADSDSGVSSADLKSAASYDQASEQSLSGYGSDTSTSTVSSVQSGASLQSASSTSSSRSRSNWRKARAIVHLYRAFQRPHYPWVQLAGHEDGFRLGESSDCILKAGSEEERVSLQAAISMGLREYVPAYHGQESQDGVEFMKLENLLSRFGQCCAMDCKLGTRTFLEKDASSTKIRADLLAKMDKVDPTEATAEERQAGGITKLRYMHFREKAGSTQSLGFRIEAMKVDGVKTKDFKTVSTEDQVRVHFAQFLQGRQDILAVFLKRLEAFRRDLLKSEFFPCHEIVGSSLLFVFDIRHANGGVWMIDFGKTRRRNAVIKHNAPWVPGADSYEDGYLTGLDSVLRILRSLDESTE